MKVTKDGASSLHIKSVRPEDAGRYVCSATNVIGQATCGADLYIEGDAAIDESSYVSPESLRWMMAR